MICHLWLSWFASFCVKSASFCVKSGWFLFQKRPWHCILSPILLKFGKIHLPIWTNHILIWTNTLGSLNKCILRQIQVNSISEKGRTTCSSSSTSFEFGKIYLAIWTNTHFNLNKYAPQFEQIHFASIPGEFYFREGPHHLLLFPHTKENLPLDFSPFLKLQPNI